MFPTINDVVNRHLKMNVKTINGFKFTHSAKFRIPIKYSIYLQNLRLNFQFDNSKESFVEKKESERKFCFEGKIEKKNSILKFGLNPNLISSFEYNFAENFKYLLFMGLDADNRPAFRNTIFYRDENLSASLLKESNIYNMSVCTGKKNFYAGAQFTFIPSNHSFASFFVLDNVSKFGDLQLAMLNANHKSYFINFKKFVKIKYDWEVEVSMDISNPSTFPDLSLAWRTNINKCIIHSSVNTSGIVKTNFKIKPNSHCRFTFTAELDHSSNDYSTGFKISFI